MAADDKENKSHMMQATKYDELSMTTTSQSSYEKPSSTRICVFQVAESADISRVTYLLEHLNIKC